MWSSFRGSSALPQRALPLLLCGAFAACTFPDYAFRATSEGDAGAGGTSTSGAGGMSISGGAAGLGAAGADLAGAADAGASDGGAVGGLGGSAGSSGRAGAGGNAGSSGRAGAAGMGGAGGFGGAAGSGGAAASAGTGGLLFSDDFESGQASRWSASPAASWAVVSASANHVYRQGVAGDVLSIASAGALTWTDQALEARLRVATFGGSTTSDFALAAVRFRDSDNFYYAALRADGKVVLKARLNGSDSSLGASVSASIATNTWYSLKVVAAGTQLSLYIDNALQQSVSGVLIASGSIALGSNNSTVDFDDVKVSLP